MTDLDFKLLKILDAYDKTLIDTEAIAQIKQAFRERGYRLSDKYSYYKSITRDGVTYYSGQEWFDRFEKEISGIAFPSEARATFYWTIEAAKRAAGIKDE